MKDGVGWIFTFADFQHPLECFLALGVIRARFHNDGKLVRLLIRPFTDLLLLTIRAMLADDRRNRIVERCGIGPVAHGTSWALLQNLLPVFLHLNFDVQPHLVPHLHKDLRGWGLVRVVVVEQAVRDGIALVTGFF